MGIIQSLTEVWNGTAETNDDAFQDALSGDLAGDDVKTGTPPLAGTSGVAALTGIRGAAAGAAGLLAQTNNREIGDVFRAQSDPSHVEDIPDNSWAREVAEATAPDPNNDDNNDPTDEPSPLAQIARFIQLLLGNIDAVVIGGAALVIVYVFGNLFTFHVGDG